MRVPLSLPVNDMHQGRIMTPVRRGLCDSLRLFTRWIGMEEGEELLFSW